jgi:hypothetical protein
MVNWRVHDPEYETEQDRFTHLTASLEPSVQLALAARMSCSRDASQAKGRSI